MARLFGWELVRASKEPDPRPSFAPRIADDGAVVVAAGGAFGTYVDLDGTVRTEAELVTKYREMALQPEINTAVDEIINETMSIDEKDIVELNLDNLENMSPELKDTIRGEFDNCLNILNFRNQAYEIYRRWYIDGRLYYHVIIDDKHPEAGIMELRYVDPRKIRKVREIAKRTVPGGADFGQTNIPVTQNEYFIFNDRGFNYGNKVVGPSTAGLKIAKDTILHVTSGLTDTQGTMVLGYLHQAIKAINQLRTLEDALVIYRLSRAPERRIWYIDVGNLPKMKAEQYVREIMVKHKNRLIYDSESGQIRDDRKFMTMLEDYWLPRREGGRGTEVTTLPGGQNLGQMEDVLYFQKKLYQTLYVPVNRLNSDALFSMGRATEVTRDEIKFSRFVSRLRYRFSQLFTKMLEKQLSLKGIMTVEEFALVGPELVYDFSRDNYFTELKDTEMAMSRMNAARQAQDMVGKYVSQSWVRKNMLGQSDDDIEQMDREIEEEFESGDVRWQNPLSLQQTMLAPPDPEAGPEPGTDEFEAQAQEHEKLRKIQEAKSRYDLLKKKKNRSLADQAELHSVAQVVAKNS